MKRFKRLTEFSKRMRRGSQFAENVYVS